MREINPTDLTKWYRGSNRELLLTTYTEARKNKNLYLENWNCPILSQFDGVILHDLHKLSLWCNEKIFLEIDKLSNDSIGVLTRIATGMLNKINYLSDDQKNLIHYNLVRSTKWLQTEIILTNLRNPPDDIPF